MRELETITLGIFVGSSVSVGFDIDISVDIGEDVIAICVGEGFRPHPLIEMKNNMLVPKTN
jgi:hypothetical protein